MDSLHKSFNPNKLLKEEFVSNLSGSSMLEIAALSTIIPILVLLRRLLDSFVLEHASDASLKKHDDAILRSKSWSTYILAMAVDFLVILLPSVLFLTVLAEWTLMSAVLLILLFLLSVAAKRCYSCSPTLDRGTDTLKENISSYRVVMVIITCLCILAVDFRIFPRRYAKTEAYGSSLMDLGVGSFVLANSLVSKQARNVSSQKWNTILKSSSPLIILGFVRLLTTTGIDYQVHVGEYGVHWNFFFTLAAVSILTSIINVPPQLSGLLGTLILHVHQSCLMNGLNVYALSNERGADIISQNKEGVISIFGYWSMYLIGVQLGNYLFFGNQSSTTLRSKHRAKILVWIFSLLFWLLTVLLDTYVERVSRRMCNIAYVTLVLAQNLQVLGILMLSDFIPGSKISVIEGAYNRNLLPAFLLANALTGLVNLSVDTLFASSISALSILLVYAFTLTIVTSLMDFYGITLKFW